MGKWFILFALVRISRKASKKARPPLLWMSGKTSGAYMAAKMLTIRV